MTSPSTLLTSFVSLVIVILMGTLSYRVFNDMVPPVKVIDVEVITPVVRPGETARFKYEILRNKNCSTQIDHFLIMTKDQNVVFRESVPGGYTNVGKNFPVVDFKIPEYIQPGEYAYRSILRSICGFYEQVEISPDAVFKVTD